MARCCCCFGLRTGSILIGLLLLLVDLAVLVWAALGVAAEYGRINMLTWPETVYLNLGPDTIQMCNWVVLGLSTVNVLSDLLLVGGATSRCRCGQVCWLVWRALLFTLATLALLVVLGLSIWLLVDPEAAGKLGLRHDSLGDLLADVFHTPEQRQQRLRNNYIAVLVASMVGLVVMSLLWGWFSAVDRNQRRLRHTTVIVKTQHMHTSRL